MIYIKLEKEEEEERRKARREGWGVEIWYIDRRL